MELFSLFLVIVAFFSIFVIGKLTTTNRKEKLKQQEPSVSPKEQTSTNVIERDCEHSEGFESCGDSCSCQEELKVQKKSTGERRSIRVLYGTQTGTAKDWAMRLAKETESHGFRVEVVDLSKYDPDELACESLVLFVISTYTDGAPPESCAPFYEWLKDHSLDFRVSRTAYESVKYAVFGIGNSVYGKRFNATGKELDRMMRRLSAQRILQVGSGDNGAGVEVEEGYQKWTSQLWKVLEHIDLEKRIVSPKETKVSEEADEDSEGEDEGEEQNGEPLVDLEDIGTMMNGQEVDSTKKKKKKPIPKKIKKKLETKKKAEPVKEKEEEDDDEEDEEDDDEEDEDEGILKEGEVPQEMLTPSLRKALTKQGYRLLGSHSGVKMCRWTKSMLRGRGGCYKHTFYGIQSYQCMEMTPSLACANKCVFCWRHHKNPVGKEWKWKADRPEVLIDSAIANHRAMIKQMKGVPGVDKDRLEEAFTIRHCALSLVGEPIIYPYINEFIDLLHSKDISSFLVTNAQFPDKIDEAKIVTQLYVSVDAATKESLKKVDRPLFTDFWERFLGSLDSLSKKEQRTVFRLTLIKDWNVEELFNYAQLVERGKPSFIEIKGVTYCGTSKASSLTMKNVPFHEEVVKFSEELCAATPFLKENYELACEHEHSCCILIAHKKFKVNGAWHTWIDYPKFHQLIKSGKEFSATDYMEQTPSWAVKDAPERGFDPDETRFKRNKPYQKSGC